MSTATHYPLNLAAIETIVDNAGTNPIVAALCNGYVRSAAHQYADDLTGELSGSGYARAEIATPTLTADGEALVLSGTDPEFASFTGAFDCIVFLEDTGVAATSRLLAAFSIAPTTITADTYAVDLPADGILRWTPVASTAVAAAAVSVDATGFTGNLSGTDTDVQTALGTLDAMATGGGTGAAFYADAIIAPGTDVSGGSFANVVILSADGFVEGSPNGVDRAFAVGQRALVPSGADAGLWTITASGACTPDATQPTTGDVVVVDVPISTAWVALGANGVTATSFEPIHKYQTRYQPIATMGVHVGQTMQDGLDDYLYPDPDNLVIADGSQYDGLPVWRTTATDLNGEALGTSVGVCRLTNQNDATIGEFPDADPAYFEAGARNGTFEVFLDSHGVTGRYFVRTVCWNDRLFRDESLLSGTMFWNAIESTVWATRGNGMASDSEPHTNSGGGGVSLGETSTTAYRGDRGKTAYDHSQTTTGNPHGTTPAEITGFDTAVRTSRLDQMAAAGADVAMGSHKITGLANGASSTDAAAFGQIPTASSSTPAAPGTAAAGSSTSWAKGDHVHPYQASVVGGQDEGTSVTSTTDTSLLDAAIFISGQSTGDTVVGWFTFSHTNTSGTGRTHSIKPKLGATTLGTLSYNCPSGATTSGVGFFVLRSEGASDHNFGAAVFTSNFGVSAFQTVTTENLSTGADLDLLGATGAGGSQTNTLQLTSITRHRA